MARDNFFETVKETSSKDAVKYDITIEDIRGMEEIGKTHWNTIHTLYKSDKKFSYATDVQDQWNPAALAMRREANRPSEVYNIVNGFIRPAANLIKENPPAISVFPISDGASKKNAQLIAGRIRSIEYASGAQRVYCDAHEAAMRASLGAWRVLPKLDDDGDSEIIIERISDCSKLIVDPAARKPDFSDAEWVILHSEISEKQYEIDYPDAHAESINGMVKISELWIRNKKKDKKTGKFTIKVKQYIYDEVEILYCEEDYPGKYVPFVLVTGPQYSVDDVCYYQSLTREIRGVQNEINWLKSEAVATVSTAPKALFRGDEDALDDEQKIIWSRSSVSPDIFLPHKKGAQIEDIKPPGPPVGYMELADKNIDMARIITGIYPDPSTQDGLSPLSGKALKQQQAGQAVATYHYVDSLNYAIKRTGDIILDLLQYYENDNKIRLARGVDGTFTPISMGNEDVDGAENFDLAYGKYGVSISAGPSYMSQKDELIGQIMEMVKADPQSQGLLMDWILSQYNLPGSEELADRFRLMLPQPIQDLIASQKGQSQDPEEKLRSQFLMLQKLSQELQQKSQMVDKLTEALSAETSQLHSKEQELQAKVQMEQDKNHTTVLLQSMREQFEERMKETDQRFEAMQTLLADQAHKREIAAKLTEQAMKHQNELENIDAKHQADVEHTVIKNVVEATMPNGKSEAKA
jgi:hypothetical protein